MQDGLLIRKRIPCDGNFLGDTVFQVVVANAFRDVVLKTAHDGSGHLGVKENI